MVNYVPVRLRVHERGTVGRSRTNLKEGANLRGSPGTPRQQIGPGQRDILLSRNNPLTPRTIAPTTAKIKMPEVIPKIKARIDTSMTKVTNRLAQINNPLSARRCSQRGIANPLFWSDNNTPLGSAGNPPPGSVLTK